MQRPLLAVVMAFVVLVAGAGPALASGTNSGLSVSVTQDDGVTVTVTNNSTAVANATVVVETIDENVSYAGVGSHETDANGTVALPAPNRTTVVSITATVGNASATTTTTLIPPNGTDSFGEMVSAFVHQMQAGNHTDTPFGQLVASFVLANNPSSSVPDHAGPDNETGPPDHAGPGNESGNETGNGNGSGPPDHAGPPDDGDSGNETGGPPDDAGPPENSD